LRVSDIAPGGVLRQRATVIQQKTGRPVPFEITDPTRDALSTWLAARGDQPNDWIFPVGLDVVNISARASMRAWSASGSQ
jgi:hypothetical protein